MFTPKPGRLPDQSEVADERLNELLEKLDQAVEEEERNLFFDEIWNIMQS